MVCDAEERLTSSGSPVHLELIVLQNNGRLPEVIKELRDRNCTKTMMTKEKEEEKEEQEKEK